MSLHRSLNVATSHPLPRLDGLSFGITARLLGAKTPLSAIRAAFSKCPEVELLSRDHDRTDVQLKLFHLSDQSDNRVGHSLINLHFAERASDLFITSRSTIRINPNTIMRGLLFDEGVECPVGLDGRLNVLGAAAAAAALTMDVPEQTELVRQIVQYVADALKALLPPGFTNFQTWLKSAELCVDMSVPDAPAAVRMLQRSAIVGATASDRDVYRACASDGDSGPVVRWYHGLAGNCSKAYAKLFVTIRFENCCTSRKAVLRLVRSGQMHLSGENAAKLAADFAKAATPGVLDLVRHARAVMADDRSPAGIATALFPLVRMAAGHTTGRGPAPSALSVEQAGTMLDALLTCGMADACGVAKGVAVRRVLDALVADGTLDTHDRRAIY